jgi:putative oxidoreductase
MLSKQMQTDIGILILRVFAGGMMLVAHGWGKLTGFSTKMSVFPDPLGIGSQLSLAGTVFTEVFCALFIVLGIKTRWFAIPAAFTMLIAAAVVHGNDPFGTQEKAWMYFFCYAVLAFTNGGKFSVRN